MLGKLGSLADKIGHLATETRSEKLAIGPPGTSEQCPTVIVTAPLSIGAAVLTEETKMEAEPTVELYDQLVDEAIRDDEGRSVIEYVIVVAVCVAAVLTISLTVEQSEPILFVLSVGMLSVASVCSDFPRRDGGAL